jgi:hypothetical protein
MSLDPKHVDRLARSFEQIGQFVPTVVAAEDGDLVRGHHSRAGAKKAGKREAIQVRPMTPIAQKFGVSLDVAKDLVGMHLDFAQRQPSQEETRSRLVSLAKKLAVDGPPEKVAARLVEMLPLSPSEIYELLPSMYKEVKRSEATKEGIAKAKEVRAAAVEGTSTRGGSEPEVSGTDTTPKIVAALTKLAEKPVMDYNQPPTFSHTRPSPPPSNPTSFTETHVRFLNQLHRVHFPYKGEDYVSVDRWRCKHPNCHDTTREMPRNGAKCYNGHDQWERMQLRIDTPVEIHGKKIAIELEGEVHEEGSMKEEERDELLGEQGVRVFHLPNELADRYGYKFAEFLALVAAK